MAPTIWWSQRGSCQEHSLRFELADPTGDDGKTGFRYTGNHRKAIGKPNLIHNLFLEKNTENVSSYVPSYDFPKWFLCFRSSKNPSMSRHGNLVSRVNGSETNFPFVSPGAWTSFYSCRALSGAGGLPVNAGGRLWAMGYGLKFETCWNPVNRGSRMIFSGICWWSLMIFHES